MLPQKAAVWIALACSAVTLACWLLYRPVTPRAICAPELPIGRYIFDATSAISEAQAVLDELGFVVLTNVITTTTCTALRGHLLGQVEQRRRALMRRRITLTAPAHREHVLHNPFQDEPVRRTLQQLGLQRGLQGSPKACSDSPLHRILHGASLTELASIIVWAGADKQPMHRDTLHRAGDTAVYTAFVPLQNVSTQTGALRVWPRSHRCDSYAQMADRGWKADNRGWPSGGLLPMEVDAGSVVLMDSRLVHAGGAHSGGPARAVFYFTWAAGQSPDGAPAPPWLPVAREYYLKSELWGNTQVPLASTVSGVEHSDHVWSYKDWLCSRVMSTPYRCLTSVQRLGKSALALFYLNQ